MRLSELMTEQSAPAKSMKLSEVLSAQEESKTFLGKYADWMTGTWKGGVAGVSFGAIDFKEAERETPIAYKTGKVVGSIGSYLATGAGLAAAGVGSVAAGVGIAAQSVFRYGLRFVPRMIITGTTFGTHKAITEGVAQIKTGDVDIPTLAGKVAKDAVFGAGLGAAGGVANRATASFVAGGLGYSSSKAEGNDEPTNILTGVAWAGFEFLGSHGREMRLRKEAIRNMEGALSKYAMRKGVQDKAVADNLAKSFMAKQAEPIGGMEAVLKSRDNSLAYLEQLTQNIYRSARGVKPGAMPSQSPAAITFESAVKNATTPVVVAPPPVPVVKTPVKPSTIIQQNSAERFLAKHPTATAEEYVASKKFVTPDVIYDDKIQNGLDGYYDDVKNEIHISTKLNSTRQNEIIRHEMEHARQKHEGNLPQSTFVSPTSSIKSFMEYFADPKEVSARAIEKGEEVPKLFDEVFALREKSMKGDNSVVPIEVSEVSIGESTKIVPKGELKGSLLSWHERRLTGGLKKDDPMPMEKKERTIRLHLKNNGNGVIAESELKKLGIDAKSSAPFTVDIIINEANKNKISEIGLSFPISKQKLIGDASQLTAEFNAAKGKVEAPKAVEPPTPEPIIEVVPGIKKISPENKILSLQKERADLARKTTLEGARIPVEEYKRINEDIAREAEKAGIAMKVDIDGNRIPAIRKGSGVFAEKEFETFPFVDAGGKTDNLTSFAAAADNIKEGEGFGPMYTMVAAPTYKTIADRNDFKSLYATRITELAEDSGLVKGAWKVLDAKDGEIIFSLLEGKEHLEATEAHRKFIGGMRQIYDELRDRANVIRRSLGKPEIGYIQNYASHVRKVSLFQDILKEIQSTISDNFDFIIPNEKVNPFAKKRIGDMEDKETNFWKIIDGYVEAIASDIYISPIIEHIKAVGSVLESRELFRSKKFLDMYIRNNLLKKPDTIDNYIGMGEGTLFRKLAGKTLNARQLGALAGNIEWMLFTQPMSLGNTIMKSGIPNTLKGMLDWLNPDVRKKIGELSAMRLKGKAGLVSTAAGDVDKSLSKIYTGRIDKFNNFLSILGNSLEYHLTGMSAAAGLVTGQRYGLKGKELNLYADYIAQVTQSMYNPETRMQLLNSMAVRTAFPFQSFAGEMFRHIRTLSGKGGGLPLDAKQRFWHISNLIIGTIIINFISERARGRKLMTAGSFIPLVGGEVDKQISKVQGALAKKAGAPYERTPYGRAPIAPMQDVDRLVSAITSGITNGDFSKIRREVVFWGMGLGGIGGAGQVNKTVDGLIALEKGRVEDVRGRKLFDVKDWSAVWRGPYGTPEGIEYKRKKSTVKMRPSIRK